MMRAIEIRRFALCTVLVATLAWCAGCASEPKKQIDPTRVELKDDIVQVIQFWPQDPWLQEGDRIVGFRVPVYFVSGETEKGAFVPGDIFVWLNELQAGPDGRRTRKPVHVWELSEAEAAPFRVTKRAIGGYYYGFPLKWSADLRLEGKQVEIQFGYERADKRVVLGSARPFRVRIPAGYQPPIQETEP